MVLDQRFHFSPARCKKSNVSEVLMQHSLFVKEQMIQIQI